MPRSKSISAAILILLLIGLIANMSFSLVFWNTVTVTRTVEVTDINEAVELDINDISVENRTLVLVPDGYAVHEYQSEIITLEYIVGVSRDLLSSTNLTIVASDIFIGDSEEYNHLVKINILGMGEEATLDLFNDTINVTIAITLDEPIDLEEANSNGLDLSTVNVEDSQTAYEEIHGQTIGFVLTFSLESKN